MTGQVRLADEQGWQHGYLLRQCPSCSAPVVSPFPEDWTIDLIKEGPEEGPVEGFVTPHWPHCEMQLADPHPGIAIRVPGRYLTLEVDQRTPFEHPFEPFVTRTIGREYRSDWCGHGAVEHALIGRGFCGRMADDPIHVPSVARR